MSAAAPPRYRLDRPLGAGGMGLVHLGVQTSAAGERLVAIKRLGGHAEMDGGARSRLVAEACLVFQLTYANICQVLDLGANDDGTFVVMEYVRGDDLAGLLEQVEASGARLDVAAAVHVAREVARALDYAHRRVDTTGRGLGIVHGDVKPSNILLSVEGEVKLADFGIARALAGASPGSGFVGGTPGFIAPEVRSGASDHRADVFSLGATLLRTLLGRRADDDRAAALAALARVPGVTDELHAIVVRALAADRDARWASAAALERALSSWLARHHPEFTPWVLADLVRRHPRASDDLSRVATGTPDGTTVGFDMRTLLEADMLTPAPAPEPRRPPTVTAAAARPWWRRPLVAAATALVAAGIAVAADGARATAPLAMIPIDAAVEPGPPSIEAPALVAPSAASGRDAAAPPRAASRTTRRPPRPPPAAAVEPTAVGYLTVNAVPWGSVFVDGTRVADETPAYRVPVAAGRHVVVVRFGDGGADSPPQRITIEAGQHRTVGFRR
jgi:serine/threonine protein kinase